MTITQSTVVTYPAPQGEPLAQDYTVTVNDKPVDVYIAQVWQPDYVDSYGGPYRFASFDFSGAVTVKVSSQHPLDHLAVLPESRNVWPVVVGDTATFTLEQPCQLSFEPDGKNGPLLLFANPLEEQVPMPNDPHVVYFGPGVHKPGAIELKDGQTLYLAGGAVVKGGVHARGKDITIRGRGILDGGDYERFKGPTRNPIALDNCTNVTIDGITIRDSWSWTLVPRGCDTVNITNIKLVASRVENSDGIDIVNSRNVNITRCFIRTDDDCIAPKGMDVANGQAVENITVSDSVLWVDKAHIFRIGCESRATVMRNITFRNLDIIHFCNVWYEERLPLAISLQPAEDMLLENVLFEDIRINGNGEHIIIEVRPQFFPEWVKKQTAGMIRNCIFRNLTVSGKPGDYIIWVAGVDEQHTVEDVIFEKVTRNGQPALADSPGIRLGNHIATIVFR